MSDIKTKLATDKFLLRISISFFAVNMGIAYIFYPHWVTFSYLAIQTRALPFFLTAMAVTIFLLLHTGKRLRAHELHKAGIAMYASAACVGLVVLIPYKGGETQIALHNLAALLFVLCATGGLAWLARKLQDTLLGISAALQVVVCITELILLARFERHPVEQWIWVVLQVFVTSLLMLSLLRIFSALEKFRSPPQ